MITYTETLGREELDLLEDDSLKVRISSLLSAYGTERTFLDFWKIAQNGAVCGVICRFYSAVTVSVAQNADFCELKEFLRVVAGSVLCTRETAEKLGTDGETFYEVIKANGCDGTEHRTVDIAELYNALSEGEDGDIHLPEYESFYVDISHRLRHGTAAAVMSDDAAALCGFISDKGALISGVAVKSRSRGRGLGKKAVDLLVKTCGKGSVFAEASKKNLPFYLACGFNITKELCRIEL